MSSHLRQMNCVWMAGRLISTAATPLIYSRISHWFPSDTGYLIHPRRWGMRNFGGEKRRMEYALRHLDCTVALFFRLAFLPFFFFSSDAAVPQSCGCNSVTVLPPPISLLHHHHHHHLLPVSLSSPLSLSSLGAPRSCSISPCLPGCEWVMEF